MQVKNWGSLLLIGAILGMGCGNGSGPVVQGGSVSSTDNNSPLKGAMVKNDIEVAARDVKVKAVYLMTADNQFKKTNTAVLGEKIYLTLETDTGWTKIDGRSFLGASEQIFDKDGTVVLDAQDLFAELETEGLEAKVAYNVNLSAVIDHIEPGYETFTVKYRIWDKKGSGEVKGGYTFKIVQ